MTTIPSKPTLEINQYIPLDKSWMIRLGVLDLLHGKQDMERFLGLFPGELNDDLTALRTASREWLDGSDVIHVGESGTLYRFLLFASWKLGRDVGFIKEGTLRDRRITQDKDITRLHIDELLRLDGGTSQWASAAVLSGSKQTPLQPTPYKLALAYEAVDHWQQAQNQGRLWLARNDATIQRQAEAFVHFFETGTMNFAPLQAEDYCFARAFGVMTSQEGEIRWPSLRQHESDRIVEMERALAQKVVTSTDHRVVQAVAMLKGNKVRFEHSGSVRKSWPQFWDFIKAVN